MDRKPIRLLITDASEEHAEKLISILRNSGVAVRPKRAANIQELQEQVETSVLDLLLCVISDTAPSIKEVAAQIAKTNKDLPILAVCHDSLFDDIADFMDMGATAVALDDNPVLLSKMAIREVNNLQARRRLRNLEIALRESEKRCNALLDSSKDAIAYVHDGMHVYANQAYLELFGFEDADEVEGLPMLDLMESGSLQEMKKLFKELSKGKLPTEGQLLNCRRNDGKELELMATFSAATVDSEPCTQVVMRMQGLDSDVLDEMNRLREMDLLTGLWNRAYFDTRLEETIQLAQNGKTDQYLIYFEPDNFKNLQEQVGLANSDLILNDIADLIQKFAHANDISARYSDHSFSILSRRKSESSAKEFTESIRSALEENISEVGKKSFATPCSFSILLVGENFENTSQIINAAAETQRKAAKDEGNAIEIYNPIVQNFHDKGDDRHWIHLVKDAINKDRFFLIYQPVVNLHGAEGEHYEILIRMRGPNNDDILPEFFLPPAQRNSLLPKIDRWVIENTIKQLKIRESQGIQTTFFVKITVDTISDPSTLPWLAKQLQAARISGESIVFEIPESEVVTNLKPVRQFHKGLQQLHCKLALAQFGSGLNSFQLLRQLPADYLKIDRSFMVDLNQSEENQKKITEITDQAHAAGKLTIAEHVEDAQSMAVLYSCGVNFVQGHFLQEPEKILAYEF